MEVATIQGHKPRTMSHQDILDERTTPHRSLVNPSQTLFALQVFYYATMYAIKISLVLFYLRMSKSIFFTACVASRKVKGPRVLGAV